jgi:formate-nitrite transporter family protein
MANETVNAASPGVAGQSSADNLAPRRSSRRIAESQITEAIGALERPALGLLISALSGGLDVSFSLFLMAVMLTQVQNALPKPVTEMLVAAMYSIGYIFVILGRSELFTEQTALAILPVLNGRTTLRQLGRLWVLVYVANLAGCACFAYLAVLIGPSLGVIDVRVFGIIADQVVRHVWWVILLSGILAGWLMGLLGWLVAAGRDTISQLVVVALVTSAIGFSHLHHSIVGSTEVLAGLFAGQGITLADYGHFLLWATLGNIVGGAFFVSLFKYSQAVYRGSEPEPVSLEDTSTLGSNKNSQ